MKRPWILLLSHGLALTVGWLAFRASDTRNVENQIPKARVTKRPRAADTKEGNRILEEMRQGWGTSANAHDLPQPPKFEEIKQRIKRQELAESEEVRKLSFAVVLPADPAAELSNLQKVAVSVHQAAFVLAWLRKDPEAALKFMEGNEVLGHDSVVIKSMELWIEEAGTDEVMGLLEKLPAWREKLIAPLVRTTMAADPSRMNSLLEQLEGNASRQDLISCAVQNLPEDKRQAAAAWIQANLKGSECGRAVMMMAIGMDDNVAAKAFLKRIVNDLDPEALQTLKGWGNYGDIMRSGVGPDSPMEERVEAMLAGGVVGKTAEEKTNNARASIISQDVSQWMAGEQLREALEFGELDAARLWQQAETRFPQYARDERAGFLNAVFSSASASDPAGALNLLDREGMTDQAGSYVLKTFERIGYTDVESAIDLVARLPQETIRQNLGAFDRCYSSVVVHEAEKRGSFWVNWMLEQPSGISRDLMLHYTARYYFKAGNDALGTRLKSMVEDDTVNSWPKL